jgi:beta-galactosidase
MKAMKTFSRILILSVLFTGFSQVVSYAQGRDVINFNFGWKFYKGDLPGAEKILFDDSSWRKLDLPHDWSIEGPFSKDNYSCTGYLPGGIGWYRKTFKVEDQSNGKKTFVSFDGIYNNSEVWINEHYLGKRPNGYISFEYDLTPFLLKGKENVIAVKVDHSLYGDSRWYTGSGIYRNVKLISVDMVHIRQWGVSYTTPEVSSQKATIAVNTSIVNELTTDIDGELKNILLSGKDTIARFVQKISVGRSAEKSFSATLVVPKPKLWSVDEPNLYSLVTVFKARDMQDKLITQVGIRTIQFDAGKGFFLNGKSMKLKGICMHHDAGALGSAVPREEMARRLDLLKEMGCNAIRTSHNPFAPDFLELCDEKGFLVIGEAFDEWELPKKKWLAGWNVGTPGKEGYSVNFKEWAKRDLTDFILRDRNHPSVIMWSIGNEIDYPNDPYTHPILNTEANPQTWAKFSDQLPHADRLGEIARDLVAVIKGIDTSRPVTAGLASVLMSNETGYADALDVAGYNYQEFRYAPDHLKYPSRPIYGSENGMTLEMWNYVADNDYVIGQFIWTGIEYIGEAGRFPMRSNTAGVIDLAGNRKPEFYFRQSIWSDKPMVFFGTTDRPDNGRTTDLWAHKRVEPVWNYDDGKKISVNAFSNCEEVELFLNNKSLGTKKMADFKNRAITWEMPFEKGTLKAVAKNKGVEAASFELRTTGQANTIMASADKKSFKADRESLDHVYVTLCDEAGNCVYSADNEITCEISGPARLIGMDDSNPSNVEDYKDNKQHAFHGKVLVYLQSTDKAGKVTIRLTSPGLKDAVVTLDVVK